MGYTSHHCLPYLPENKNSCFKKQKNQAHLNETLKLMLNINLHHTKYA